MQCRTFRTRVRSKVAKSSVKLPLIVVVVGEAEQSPAAAAVGYFHLAAEAVAHHSCPCRVRRNLRVVAVDSRELGLQQAHLVHNLFLHPRNHHHHHRSHHYCNYPVLCHESWAAATAQGRDFRRRHVDHDHILQIAAPRELLHQKVQKELDVVARELDQMGCSAC
jgi:hypothetical protein